MLGWVYLVLVVCTVLQGVIGVSLPAQYDIIGPFVMGQREEGIDTLESYGGIFNLKPDNTTYPSELGNGGVVGWSTAVPNAQNNVQVAYPEISWEFLQGVMGWSVWLWYGYAVGSFSVPQTGRYFVQCTGVRQFWIDEFPFLGDFYSYGVGGHPTTLTAGTHTVVLRLTSSVRLTQSPVVNFNFQVTPITQSGSVFIVGDTTIPTVVNGYLASPFVSVTVTNIATSWLTNVILYTKDPVIGPILSTTPVSIAPGQKFALTAQLESLRVIPAASCPVTALFGITYAGSTSDAFVNMTFNCVTFGSAAYSFTFLDYDGTVQYASVIPPSDSCNPTCGVMLATHGAGVEASSPFWTGAIPQLDKLWIIFPTGRRPWGYDWESSSRVNAFKALDYLAEYQPGVPVAAQANFTVDPSSVLYVGHSMGGHGCWSLTSHFGDRALAAACAAGFVKLQFYVFYTMKAGDSFIDPVLRGLLDSSIAENDNDIYTTNLVGIPVIARYGQNDSNVCPWHSRRMARMVDEMSNDPDAVIISEVPNQNHWFTGVLGDSFMTNFYGEHDTSHPDLPTTFTVSTVNPASFGGRGNIVILQLTIPFRPSNLCNEGGGWTWCSADYATTERSPVNYGPFRQIFETNFVIVYGTGGSADENTVAFTSAVTIANFYNMYGRGSPIILADTAAPPSGVIGNAILIGGPHMNLWTEDLAQSLPVPFAGSSWTLASKKYSRPCQGILFLAPSQRLPSFVGVIAGTDACGLDVAVRAVPQRSGVVVPDFMVVDQTWVGKGAQGILAAGYWDNTWQFSYASGYA